MKPSVKKILVASFAASSAAAVSAADEASGVALGLKIGSNGAGFELSLPVSETLNVRGGLTRFSLNRTMTEDDIEYQAKVKLGLGTLLADWHPFAGAFRLSTGLATNGTRFDLTAKPGANGTYTINDQVYQGADIGSLTGSVAFSRSPAPYFGFGWGNAASARAFSFSFDLGVVWQHAPTSRLEVACGSALSTTECQALQSNVQAAQVELDEAMKQLKWYPALSLGIAYRF